MSQPTASPDVATEASSRQPQLLRVLSAKTGTALIIGGGLQMGGIIGATDQRASVPTTRPVHIHEILSTAYHHLGIDVKTTLLPDTAGQPRYLLDGRNPIRELL